MAYLCVIFVQYRLTKCKIRKMNKPSITVMGAGIVGICCAIELQRSGYDVEVIDRRAPGTETSHGNAGILSLSSVVPLASPELLPRIPGLLLNRYADFRLHYAHLPQLLPWLFRFLLRCNRRTYRRDSQSINALTVASVAAHRELIRQSDAEYLINDGGGLRLYRRLESFDRDAIERELFERCQVEYDILDPPEIKKLEPDLDDRFVKAVWIKKSLSLSDPQALCRHYADYFRSLGGVIRQLEVESIRPVGDNWRLNTSEGEETVERLVVCLGAWTGEMIKPLGYRNPVAIERGYHMMYSAQANRKLLRPVFDVDASYVMIPMSQGIRVTTGSNLVYRETEATPRQLEMVEPRAREAFPLDQALLDKPWMGRRSSTPDSLPIIGPAPRHKNLWLNYAHAHMGLTMAPISGQIIASQVTGGQPPLDVSACSPARYL